MDSRLTRLAPLVDAMKSVNLTALTTRRQAEEHMSDGVKEDDTGASGSDGGLAGEDGATLLEGGDRLVQVVGAVAHLLDHILILGNVLSNGAVLAEWGEQLNDGRLLAAFAGTEPPAGGMPYKD